MIEGLKSAQQWEREVQEVREMFKPAQPAQPMQPPIDKGDLNAAVNWYGEQLRQALELKKFRR